MGPHGRTCSERGSRGPQPHIVVRAVGGGQSTVPLPVLLSLLSELPGPWRGLPFLTAQPWGGDLLWGPEAGLGPHIVDRPDPGSR